MKKRLYFIPLIAFCFTALTNLVSCDKPTTEPTSQTEKPIEVIDYVSNLKLNMNSSSAKLDATVKLYVDGDTTHFFVDPSKFNGDDVLKARYLAVNTPESTGRIDEYGKAASNFTRSKLESAESIILESDSEVWSKDSSGGRIMSWVWYRTSATEDYRNLNLEILQNGYGRPYSALSNRYGQLCYDAANQAKALKLKLWSGEKDPDYYYGEAVELTLKELRLNIADYVGYKVAFEGTITKNYNNSIYLEDYDEESGLYYGIPVYLGYSANGEILKRTNTGMRVRMVGSCQYYEAGGTYQISDIQYKTMDPTNPLNVQVISTGNKGAYVEITGEQFDSKVEIFNGEEVEKFDFGYLALSTTVSMKNLQVESIYTTIDTESSNYGAMTLTCKTIDNHIVTIRTVVLKDENGKVITEETYKGKTISVKGIVDYFEGKYQIKVYSKDNIEIIK